MKSALALLTLFLFFLSFVSPSFAAVSGSVQYVRGKNAARIFLGNLKGVKKVSYTLIYEGNGMTQGARSDISPTKKTTSYSKDVYLGTCSHKICTPQRNIKNIRIEVVCKYTNGSSSTKTYKAK